MFWLLIWLFWAIYCVLVVPTWCAVFVALRGRHGVTRAWGVAAVLALIWPVFWPQHIRWRRRNQPVSLGEQIAAEFHSVYG